MKSTLTGGPEPHPSDHRQSRDAEPIRRQDGTDRFYNPTAPKSVYNPVYNEPAQGTGRSSRVPSNPTAPVTNLESKMADLSMMSRCFVCTGGQLGDSAQFTVCRDHAMDLFRMMRGNKEAVRGDSEVRRKPSSGNEAPYEVRPYEVPRKFGNEVRAKPYEAAPDEARRKSASFGRNDLDNPHQSVPPQRSASASEWEQSARGGAATMSPGHEAYERQRREAGRGYPSQQSPGYGNGQQRRYGNEQGWPPPSGVFEEPRDQVGRHGKEFDRPRQREQPRDAAGRYGNEFDHPPQHRGDPAGRYPNELDYPQPNHPPQHTEQGRWPSDDRGARHPHSEQGQESRPQQATGRGAEGGATGGSSTEPRLKMKSLCATTGCSFKGYERLKWLCPDCYIEQYSKYPEFYSPDEFPLV